MGRIYDIAQRIANANQRPTVKIDDEHEYTINTGKSIAIMAQALASEIGKDESEKELEAVDKIIALTLGEEAAEYISQQDMSISAYMLIVEVIMAAFADEDLKAEGEKKPKK